MRIAGSRLAVMALAAAVGLGAVACGSSGDSGSGSTATTAPEELRTSAADVAAGLGEIVVLTGQIATTAAVDKEKATDLADEIETHWQPIEGTVKANDQDAYLSFEDSFAVIEKAAAEGDGTAAASAAADIASNATQYVIDFPA